MPDHNTSIAGLSALVLFPTLLVTASMAVTKLPARLKVALHVLAGMAVGVAAGFALGAALGSGELAGDLGFMLLFCGGIWVSVRSIRQLRNP